MLQVRRLEGHGDVALPALVGSGVDTADVRAFSRDRLGQVGKETRPVVGNDVELDRVGRALGTRPGDRDLPVRVVEKVLDVGAALRVDRDAAAPGDVAQDLLPRHR